MKFLFILSAWFVGYIFFVLFIFINLSSDKPVTQNITVMTVAVAADTIPPFPVPSVKSIMPENDIRSAALQKFLTEIKSPLLGLTDELIEAADRNSLDYALIPAIAMQESGGCKRIPVDSYNCWGLGVYGNKVMRFTSYSEAIKKVAEVIHESYIKKGLTNPTLLEDKWTPSSRGLWSYSVNYFMIQIHNIEQNLTAS